MPLITSTRHDAHATALFDVQIMRGHGLGHIEPHDGIDLTGFLALLMMLPCDRTGLPLQT